MSTFNGSSKYKSVLSSTMGSKPSTLLKDDQVKLISSQTGFSGSEIGKLYSRFTQLDKDHKGFLTRADFLSIHQLSLNPIGPRIISVFLGTNEGIDFMKFAQILATFNSNRDNEISQKNSGMIKTILPTQRTTIRKETSDNDSRTRTLRSWDHRYKLPSFSLDEHCRAKLLFIFKLYDQDDDGRIGFVDLKYLIRTLSGNCMDDNQLDKIALRAFVEVDDNNDGFIDFCEFCKVFEGQDLDNKLRVKFFY